MFLLVAGTMFIFTACNSDTCSTDCAKKCCTENTDKCDDDCAKKCCTDKVTTCSDDCKKACCLLNTLERVRYYSNTIVYA